MINLYIDLDDVVFDFKTSFLNFVNESMDREFNIPTNMDSWSIEKAYGVSEKLFNHFLLLYGEYGRFETQKFMPGASKMMGHFHLNPNDKFNIPHFITSREPEAYIQTLRQLNDIYHSWLAGSPTNCYHLYMANHKRELKYNIIRELNRINKQGIFIEDNPDYVNDVVKYCPGVVIFWFNYYHYNKSLCEPHYSVSSWDEIYGMLSNKSLSFDTLLRYSKHPGVQLEIE